MLFIIYRRKNIVCFRGRTSDHTSDPQHLLAITAGRASCGDVTVAVWFPGPFLVFFKTDKRGQRSIVFGLKVAPLSSEDAVKSNKATLLPLLLCLLNTFW